MRPQHSKQSSLPAYLTEGFAASTLALGVNFIAISSAVAAALFERRKQPCACGYGIKTNTRTSQINLPGTEHSAIALNAATDQFHY